MAARQSRVRCSAVGPAVHRRGNLHRRKLPGELHHAELDLLHPGHHPGHTSHVGAGWRGWEGGNAFYWAGGGAEDHLNFPVSGWCGRIFSSNETFPNPYPTSHVLAKKSLFQDEVLGGPGGGVGGVQGRDDLQRCLPRLSSGNSLTRPAIFKSNKPSIKTKP